MDIVQEIESFYGVYLLVNKNEDPKFCGRCYVGYTVDPNRRIKQHNKGHKFGGARHTSRVPGPWVMVMICHGFPDNISALRFEWAWQQPKASRRLKTIESIQRKNRGESNFKYHFRILTEMINSPPWTRLPLKIRWLEQDFVTQFTPEKFPKHMSICYGLIKTKKKTINTLTQTNDELLVERLRKQKECLLCMEIIERLEDERVFCVNPKCKLVSHLKCLAKLCLEDGHYVPIDGICPLCDSKFLWGDIIRKKNGCCDFEEENSQDEDYDI